MIDDVVCFDRIPQRLSALIFDYRWSAVAQNVLVFCFVTAFSQTLPLKPPGLFLGVLYDFFELVVVLSLLFSKCILFDYYFLTWHQLLSV
jgi:hypothetical protein